jgi:hypothetical protein
LDREAGVRGDLERLLQEKAGFWEKEVTFLSGVTSNVLIERGVVSESVRIGTVK